MSNPIIVPVTTAELPVVTIVPVSLNIVITPSADNFSTTVNIVSNRFELNLQRQDHYQELLDE